VIDWEERRRGIEEEEEGDWNGEEYGRWKGRRRV
jgi:hypothetical protein